MSNIHHHRFVLLLTFVVVACLMTMPPVAARCALPSALEVQQYDWVCVTDAALVDAYAPLAAQRESQGLATLVLALDDVILWSPAGDDTTRTLRWLSEVAYGQWGARYLLLGGSHALLPAPLHRLDYAGGIYIHPTDAYYACLSGDWDTDGDGFVADWEEDEADPTIHLRVGRVPADSVPAVTNFVTKVLAFEDRPAVDERGGLFVSSLMRMSSYPISPHSNWAIEAATGLRDSVLAADPSLRIGTIFQGLDPQDPADPLQEAALVDSLAARPHDFVFCQLRGTTDHWELIPPQTLEAQAFDPLAGAGHSFIFTMMTSDPIGDTRYNGILSHLLTLPDGGAAAAIVSTGVGYIVHLYSIQNRLWPGLVKADSGRLGDEFVAALESYAAEVGLTTPPRASTYWYQALFGDPATLVRPSIGQTSQIPVVTRGLNVQAAPNPFNPTTEISFEVPDIQGEKQPVSVEIFDLRGRRIRTLVEGAYPPGPQRVLWQAKAPGGLYFARVTVAGDHQVVKVTLVE